MSATPPPKPNKKEVALALLEHSTVYIHLDPRNPSVVVPRHFKKRPQLVLQVGLNMPVPIPDLRLDDDEICCTLSFHSTPFSCVVPWSSVYAMVGDDGRGMVWEDDVPVEVAKAPRDTKRQSAESNSANCSFCGKSRTEVTALIDGPSATICNECIGLCLEILAEQDLENQSALPGVDDDGLHATLDGKAHSPAAKKREVSHVVGQDTLNLVKHANELHAVIVDLDDALRRHELDQPSEGVSDCGVRRDKAYRDWNQLFSKAVSSLIEQVGLETCSPRSPSPSSRSSQPGATESSSCSFCGKSRREVKQLIAGPTVHICDECVRMANQAARTQVVK